MGDRPPSPNRIQPDRETIPAARTISIGILLYLEFRPSAPCPASAQNSNASSPLEATACSFALMLAALMARSYPHRMQRTQPLIRSASRFLLAWAFTLMLPVLLFAQAAAPAEPTLDPKKAPAAWIGFFIMFVLAAVVIAISLMPSKRGHQD